MTFFLNVIIFCRATLTCKILDYRINCSSFFIIALKVVHVKLLQIYLNARYDFNVYLPKYYINIMKYI